MILHAKVIGEGKPIVLIHGYLSSSHYFKSIQKHLARDYKVIALDLLGFGKSPKPKIEHNYDTHIEAISRTLESLGIEKPFTLIGHSLGAMISLRYAVKRPSDINQLLLFNPPIFTDPDQVFHHHAASGKHYRMMLHSSRRDKYWQTLKLIPHIRTGRRPAINFADTLKMSSYAREGSYDNIIKQSELLHDLEIVRPPTLLVIGRYDRLVYIDNLKGKKLAQNVAIKIVETGHHTLVRTPKLGEKLIREYIS
jgi:cis-3-alkyl-4-acyloxetan-2-one decarboxylase